MLLLLFEVTENEYNLSYTYFNLNDNPIVMRELEVSCGLWNEIYDHMSTLNYL
jgi:hypothetical protein